MDGFRVAIIIPAFNEENNIQNVIRSIYKYNLAVIVVDDCSTDNTNTLASEMGVIVVKHPVNYGYEKAIETGFEKAIAIDCEYAITFDADGQHEASLIKEFKEAFSQGFDLVLAVRDRFPRFSEYLFSYFSQLVYGISDPLCGMKGYSLRLYQTYGAFDKNRSIGTELAFFSIAKLKVRFKELNFTVKDRVNESRYGYSLKANLKIFLGLLKVIKNFGVFIKK